MKQECLTYQSVRALLLTSGGLARRQEWEPGTAICVIQMEGTSTCCGHSISSEVVCYSQGDDLDEWEDNLEQFAPEPHEYDATDWEWFADIKDYFVPTDQVNYNDVEAEFDIDQTDDNWSGDLNDE